MISEENLKKVKTQFLENIHVISRSKWYYILPLIPIRDMGKRYATKNSFYNFDKVSEKIWYSIYVCSVTNLFEKTLIKGKNSNIYRAIYDLLIMMVISSKTC